MVTDALAIALARHRAVCGPHETPTEHAAAILADPILRAALTAALREMCDQDGMVLETPEYIVAHMLPEASDATD